MKKLCVLVLALAMLLCATSALAEAATNALTFAGLGPSIQVDTPITANEPYQIAFITKNMTNPGLVAQLEGAGKACEEFGCEIVKLAPATADSVEEQVTLVDDMIQMGVDGILIHCADSNGIMPAVRRAEEAGIPIIGIGTVPAEETLMRTGPDYVASGYAMGEYVADKLAGEGTVIILEGAPGAQNSTERLNALEDVFSDYPGIEIVASQTANWKRVEAMSVMENLLQKYSDVDAVIALNDEMAVGALQAIQAANLSDIMIFGFDGNADCAAAIKDGTITATYNTDGYGAGYVGVSYMVQYLNDGTLPPQYHMPFPSPDAEDVIIDSTNIDDYLENDAWFNY